MVLFMASDTASWCVHSQDCSPELCSNYLSAVFSAHTRSPAPFLPLPCDMSSDVTRTEQSRSYCAINCHCAEAGSSPGNWCSRKHGLTGWMLNVTDTTSHFPALCTETRTDEILG